FEHKAIQRRLSLMRYRNLVELHRLQAERLGPRPALRQKRHGLYHDLTWSEYRDTSLACAAALTDAAIGEGDRVGRVGENSTEWLIADMGILSAGAINVPPHAPLTARQIEFQFQDAGVRWLFVSCAEQLAKVEQIRSRLSQVRGFVLLDCSQN